MRGQSKKLAQLAALWASGELHTQASAAQEDADFDQALAAFGLQAPDDDAQQEGAVPDVVYLWPCNLKTWALWQRLQTMWRVGMGGREGLDWSCVVTWLRHAQGMGPKQIGKTMHLLQAMEYAALAAWAKQRDEKTKA